MSRYKAPRSCAVHAVSVAFIEEPDPWLKTRR